MGSELGQRSSQWTHFGETNFCCTATPKLPLHPSELCCFLQGFLRHVGSPVLWVGTCSYRQPWAEASFLPSQCTFPPLAPRGSALSKEWQPEQHWQPKEVAGGAGSCRLLPAPLVVGSFLQPCWNQPPPELLTGLRGEALGITPLVSLSSLAPPPGAFCCRNKARRGHAANMCQELQRRKLASFT